MWKTLKRVIIIAIGSKLKAEKSVEHEGNGNTNNSWCSWKCPQIPGKETRGTDYAKKNQDHSDHNTVKTN